MISGRLLKNAYVKEHGACALSMCYSLFMEQERTTLYQVLGLLGECRQTASDRQKLETGALDLYTDPEDFDDAEVVVKCVLPDKAQTHVCTLTVTWGETKHLPPNAVANDRVTVMGDVALRMQLSVEAEVKTYHDAWDLVATLSNVAHVMFKIDELVEGKQFTRKS